MHQELQRVQLNEQLLAQRAKGINKLAEGVQEISELFQDMATLVVYQGEKIDNIEINIINSLSHVTKSNIELKTAEKYQSKIRKNSLCCAFIIGLNVVVIIVVIVIIVYIN